jgi:hypothetical protein
VIGAVNFPSMIIPSPLTTAVISAIRTTNTTTTATFGINTDGSISVTLVGVTNSQSNVPATWINRALPATIGNNFYVRCFSLSGSASIFDTPDVWLALSSNRTFGTTRSTLGGNVGTAQIQIAGDSGGTDIRLVIPVQWTASVTAP